ncbi:MAG: NTP transferase domain-containing protein [Planctomycetota bacterium]
MSTSPLVCILTAGRGTRLGSDLARLNKAILPLGDRALISHIIDAFPDDARFVIALGYEAAQVRGYIELAHADAQVQFIDVDPWCGPGSGPGRSLLACADALNEPFYFVACDSIPTAPIDVGDTRDWIGVSRVPPDESVRYCNARCDGDVVVELLDKQRADGPNDAAFTGIMHIASTDLFWNALREQDLIAGEHQVSNGLRALVDQGSLHARQLAWCDAGDEDAYRDLVVAHHGFDFSKPGEALFLYRDRVIKLFADADQAARRIDRAQNGPAVFPTLIEAPAGYLAYDFVPGETLYTCITPDIFEAFLTWCDTNLWVRTDVDASSYGEACHAFYRTKTLDRLALLTSPSQYDAITHANGESIPPLADVLDAISWDELCDGCPTFFHGDLQFDNVIRTDDDSFLLLDWRPDFAGRLDVGDLYYDLGKMLGGIRMNYGRIKHGDIQYELVDGDARYEIPTAPNPEALTDILRRYVDARGLDWSRIEMINALIYLNMAPLHVSPFREALLASARQLLADTVYVTG